MSIISDIKIEFKKKPLMLFWRLAMWVPLCICLVLTSLMVAIYNLSVSFGIEWFKEVA